MASRRESEKRDEVFYNGFPEEDTRHYGVFIRGPADRRHLEIDLRRYEEFFELTGSMKTHEKATNGEPLVPARRHYLDYQINLVSAVINDIHTEWIDNKTMIHVALDRIQPKQYEPYADDLAASGIIDFDEAQLNATIRSVFSEQRVISRRSKLSSSLYAQFFHQMAARIEALTTKMLANSGYDQDSFARNVLYTFGGHTEETVSRIEGFAEYDRLYAIWNFIKHNNRSVYRKVKEHYPDTLTDTVYAQGDLACYYVKFSDDLVESLLHGVELFLKGYCRDVLSEDD